MGGSFSSGGSKDRSCFEEALAARFPAIAGEISDIERGLLHLEMGVFAQATCAAIDRGDSEEIAAHFSFIAALFAEAALDLKNAIYVSYLETVFLGRDEERYRVARCAMSDSLRAALAELEEYFKEIADWRGSLRLPEE
jgi:hypothetical protein